MCFTFKTCQIVADTSITTQFHEVFECIFWRVFVICPEFTPPVGTTDTIPPCTVQFGQGP